MFKHTIFIPVWLESVFLHKIITFHAISPRKTDDLAVYIEEIVSTYLSAENLGHSFHDHWLFRNQTIGINNRQRVALVGINGAGKSTLLKLFAGQFLPTVGKVVYARDIRLGYLEQDPSFDQAHTISDYIFHSDNRQQQLIRRYEELLETEPDNIKEFVLVSVVFCVLFVWVFVFLFFFFLG